MVEHPSLHGRQIVCVGFADWHTDLWTNQQHLMSRLARHNDVLFVESLGLRRPQLARRDLRRIARRLANGVRGPHAIGGAHASDGSREAYGLPAASSGSTPGAEGTPDDHPAGSLHVLSPLVLPFHSNRAVRALNARLLPALVRRAARSLSIQRPILWSYVPQAEVLLDALAPELVVYHCVDDIASQPGIDAQSFAAAERRFVAAADLVLASAPALAERLRTLSANVLYAPNVADTRMFARALHQGPLDPALAALPAPRIVFTGAIVTTKIDIELIVRLARARPNWSFALVGPIGPGDPHADVSALEAEPNVHLLGPRSYEQLPDVLRGAHAGLIPYARNPLTQAIFPMKVYEYMAAGLPIVATPLPALEGVEGVATAASASEIAHLLDQALADDSPQRRADRSRLAARHSWDERLREIGTAIDAAERRRAASMAGGRER